MKRIVFLTCIGSLALALTAWGAPRDKGGQRLSEKRRARAARMSCQRGPVAMPRSMRTAPSARLRGKTSSYSHASERWTQVARKLGHESVARGTDNRTAARKTSTRSRTTATARFRGKGTQPQQWTNARNRERNVARGTNSVQGQSALRQQDRADRAACAG